MTSRLALLRSVLILSAALPVLGYANTTYFKCQTSEGTVFSQFPCDKNAKEQEVTHTKSPQRGPKEDYNKQLSELEKENKRDSINMQIRSTKHKVVMLKRERSAKTLAEEQRLERLMSDDERKALKKEVQVNIKDIERRYTQRIKETEQKLARLEKSLAKYQ
ncbi:MULTISPECIES: DUF4124 domain-containing protein [unclassified Pseudoalteromonas]|uniref:DUF4124 domain-containing protein n=1 Tax=unclassified Pseudoalteromonas TaxID=194690 RepID=UPI00131A0351|nr:MULTISPECIES: DUF4124 domain-containing protein [unclassified Pseudoalteromonas]